MHTHFQTEIFPSFQLASYQLDQYMLIDNTKLAYL